MKIVNIISCCGSGGAEVLVKESLLELSEKKENKIELWVMSKICDSNMRVTQAKIDFEKKYIEELESVGIKVKFLDKRANKDLLKSWLKIRKFYKVFKPDVIHSHLEQVTFHMLMGTLGFNLKRIQTIHNTRIVYPNLQKYFIGLLVNYFVSISPETTNEILKLGIKKEKIKELFNGINIKKFENLNKKYGEKINYIAIGRLIEQKNYNLMIQSFNSFLKNFSKEEKQNYKLSIVGEGPDEEKIKKLLKILELEENVELLGVRNDIVDLLKKSDIYLMSSKWEGFSISLIEAAASGLAIIATDVGSNFRIVKNNINGYLVKSENQEEYCRALQEISNLKKIKEFSKNSTKISKEFDLKNIIDDLERLYRSKK